MKGCSIANTGEGKTLCVVARVFDKLRADPELQVYANFHIYLPRCHFTPYMFLPFNKLKKCMVIYDDVSNTEVLQRYTKVCANYSRKSQMELIFTGQYYTMIPKSIRSIMDFRLYPRIKGNTLYVYERRRGKPPLRYKYYNVFETIGQFYDTDEIVPIPTESDVINELIKICKTKKDIERNLMLYTGNKKERQRLYNIIIEKMGLNDENKANKNEKQQQLKYILYCLNKQYKRDMRTLARYFKTNLTKVFNLIKDVEYELDELDANF
ncbi:MAG TPA: hypothetical protein ENI51_07855 [Candidatus Atribacteria bacterium]|nr:hypothetical protein [Candidatus Atribacteria bacterium]